MYTGSAALEPCQHRVKFVSACTGWQKGWERVVGGQNRHGTGQREGMWRRSGRQIGPRREKELVWATWARF